MGVHEGVREEFIRRFSQPAALLIRAPGRVNPIGEHTDYNDGFVLPMAIDRTVWIAMRPVMAENPIRQKLTSERPGTSGNDSFSQVV